MQEKIFSPTFFHTELGNKKIYQSKKDMQKKFFSPISIILNLELKIFSNLKICMQEKFFIVPLLHT